MAHETKETHTIQRMRNHRSSRPTLERERDSDLRFATMESRVVEKQKKRSAGGDDKEEDEEDGGAGSEEA